LAQMKKIHCKEKKQKQACTNTSIFWHLGLSLSAQWSWMCPRMFLTLSPKRLPLHMQHVSKVPYCSFMRFSPHVSSSHWRRAAMTLWEKQRNQKNLTFETTQKKKGGMKSKTIPIFHLP
jgi:hypothetical protein